MSEINKPTKASLDRIKRLGDTAFTRRRDLILDEYVQIDPKQAKTTNGMLRIAGLFLEVLIDIRNNIYNLGSGKSKFEANDHPSRWNKDRDYNDPMN